MIIRAVHSVAALAALAGCASMPSGSTTATNLADVAPTGPFAPRDECSGLPGASEFLARLESSVVARNADALLLLTSDDVYLDFGGGNGKALLRARLADPEYELWGALDNLIQLGCASVDGVMILPWYFAQELSPVHDEGFSA